MFCIPVQKDADHALVVALASRAVFDSNESDDMYTVAMASPLLQVYVWMLPLGLLFCSFL